MDSPLLEVWHAASGSPFLPAVGKGTQFFVGFLLLLISFTLAGAFTLSMLLFNSSLDISQFELLLTKNPPPSRQVHRQPASPGHPGFFGICVRFRCASTISTRPSIFQPSYSFILIFNADHLWAQIRPCLHVLRGRSLRLILRYPGHPK